VRLKLAQGLFANFTPQQRTNIASVFDDIDINSDGYLSKAEFGQWYASQNTKGSTEPPTRQQVCMSCHFLVFA
jgi:Ca2+-binding EF-hand superfamily protein